MHLGFHVGIINSTKVREYYIRSCFSVHYIIHISKLRVPSDIYNYWYYSVTYRKVTHLVKLYYERVVAF